MLPVTPRGIQPPICALTAQAGKPQATSRIRTDDPVITSDVLYQLSYGGGHADRRRPTRSGAEGNRTPDLSIANAALSQLSYGPLRNRFHGIVSTDGRERTRTSDLYDVNVAL